MRKKTARESLIVSKRRGRKSGRKKRAWFLRELIREVEHPPVERPIQPPDPAAIARLLEVELIGHLYLAHAVLHSQTPPRPTMLPPPHEHEPKDQDSYQRYASLLRTRSSRTSLPGDLWAAGGLSLKNR